MERKAGWIAAGVLLILGALSATALLPWRRPPAPAQPPQASARPAAPAAWLAEGLARADRDASGLAAWDLLRPTGPVPLDRLAQLSGGSLEDPAYERAVATAQLLANYLRGHGITISTAEAFSSALAHPPADLAAGFSDWLQQFGAQKQPVIPPDPTPWMGAYAHPAPEARTQYRLELTWAPETYKVAGKQTVRFTNTEAVTLDSLYFHLFPNAPHFAQGRRAGDLTVAAVQVDGQEVDFTGGSDEVLGVALPKPLAPGAAVTVDLTWTATVPDEDNRYGVEGSTVLLGNFYPIVAMHDQGGWHLDRYVDAGDPFYSEVADYDVTFTVPSGYQVAATGHPDETRLHFTATNVRDFAAALGPDLTVAEQDVDGVRLRYVRTSGSRFATSPDALRIAAGALRFYSQHFGAYPYQDLTIVSAGFGMEYPQFVMAGSPVAIAHEIAHQWWYGQVGNDELRQIWDEGLTEFSSRWYLSQAGLPTGAAYSPSSAPLDRTLYDYSGHPAEAGQYGATIYGRGWRMWDALRSAMGDASFTAMLQDFVAQHRYGIVTWADWREAIGHAGGDQAQSLFDSWVK